LSVARAVLALNVLFSSIFFTNREARYGAERNPR
jgi:hypothetical protein